MCYFKQVTVFAECLDEVFVPKKEGEEEEEEEPEVRNLVFVDDTDCFSNKVGSCNVFYKFPS